MFTKLLVPLDRSPLAEQAIPRALAIARATGTALDFVLVHEPPPFAGIPRTPWESVDPEVEQGYLKSVVAEVAADTPLRITSAILRGTPAEMICARAQEVGADLIVMTSHGRSGFSRLWLGSVADAVVRHATVPVFLLRPAGLPQPRRTPASAFTRLLVPLDGSALASDILPTATALAQASGASMTLLRVILPVPLVTAYDPSIPLSYIPVVRDEPATTRLADDVTGQLGEVARRVRDEGHIAVDASVLVSEHVADAIVDFAHAGHFDVIAMSTHGHGASRWLVGSVADKVLRAGGLPVMLRRPSRVREETPLLTEASVVEQLPALSGA